MVTLHEVITFLVSMQISISSLQTHNVNRCGRSRHLARKLSLRRKRSSPNVFEMAATETITSIILIKLIRVSLGTVRHPRRFKIVVIDIQITLKQTSLKWLETNNLFNNLIQRNQSAAFSSGKVRPNHETNINIIARRTGKDVNSHTVLDGIITTIMATRQAHADGWFIVFDTLTLADDRLEAFYDNPNALRDYFRDIGRMVLAAEGRKANDSHADCYQYFCVPEYGTANGRLHFHAVHFMRTLPTGSVDPNFGRRVRNRRQLNSLQNTWPYGYSMPIAVRYTQDAFSRSGWLWPVDAKGEPLKATSYMAVGFYVAKYVNKKSDMDLAAKGLGAKEWNNSLKTKLSLLPKKLFRIRMSRNFGMKMLTMTNLSTECLIQLTKLGYDATPFNQILKQNAKREMRLRLGKVTVADVLAAQPV